MEGNGKNRFYIVIKSHNIVYDEEWAEILFGVNWWLQHHKEGKFQNVGAYLDDAEVKK